MQWNKFRNILQQFELEEEPEEIAPFGNGHINDTLRVRFRGDTEQNAYILQKINKKVFHHPEEVMENASAVTSFLREKIIQAGGDPEREVLNFLKTADGTSYCVDEEGEYWRISGYIRDSVCYEEAKTAQDFYSCALAFGGFQHQLSDFPAQKLHETIPDFHNTSARYRSFEQAVQEDICGRVSQAQQEILFIRQRRELADVFMNLLEEKKIPLRVTHNDTKLNNIMFDRTTGKGLCVIDLDTVMPGFSAYDFGDAIRFGASTAAEDEKDLDKVTCDLQMYEVYVKGFLESCGSSLTPLEIRLLPMGAKAITYEQAIRFLGDYLQGDIYYKTSYPGQNLDRARTQLKLVADMEEKWDEMQDVIKKYAPDLM